MSRELFLQQTEFILLHFFLAPSENVERTVTENRKKCMAVIADVYNHLKEMIPNQIGRYSDEFYPTSTGDNFIKAGMPTILFEGGHFVDDYTRRERENIIQLRYIMH
jgi:hypothetical protein